MDSGVHILAPFLFTEPLKPPAPEGAAYARWRERLVIVLAALAPDADGVLGFIDLAWYSRYHRVATHSVWGLFLLSLLCAFIAFKWPERWMFRRLRPKGGPPVHDPTFRRLCAFAGLAAALHFLGDWVAAWGVWPLWPFSNWDARLARVNSIDPRLTALTVAAWTIQQLMLMKDWRRAAWATAAVWAAIFVVYVWLRPLYGEPAFV